MLQHGLERTVWACVPVSVYPVTFSRGRCCPLGDRGGIFYGIHTDRSSGFDFPAIVSIAQH